MLALSHRIIRATSAITALYLLLSSLTNMDNLSRVTTTCYALHAYCIIKILVD